MKLKKINIELGEALKNNGYETPTLLQEKTFGTIKSGVDTLLIADQGQGKTLALVIAAIQRIGFVKEDEVEIATQALIVVKDREKVLEMMELFEILGSKLNLRIYGIHERTDFDNDKNMLSFGNDVLIGTPERLNEMLSSAGYDVNQLKFYMIDDLDEILRNRLEPRVFRLSDTIGKTQRVYAASVYDERVEVFMDKTMNEDVEIFDFTEEEED